MMHSMLLLAWGDARASRSRMRRQNPVEVTSGTLPLMVE